MFSGTQYTALVTSLRVGDWDGVVNLIGARIDQAVAETTSNVMRVLSPLRLVQAPGRALDTDFIVSPDRDALAIYSVELSVTGSLLVGTSHAEVVFNINGVAFGQHVLDLTSALTLGLSITPKVRKPLILFVPAGCTVNLSTNTSGNGTVVLVNSQEALL